MVKKENSENKGVIFDIQRYSIHDGNGIRTLVFMKGCPLKCLWCSNPESQNFDIEIGSITKDCIGCGDCYNFCKQGAIVIPNYEIDRTLCNNCLECAKVCTVKAKRAIGREFDVEELLETVERDRLFYQNSGGGITVGGGEPTAQSDFVSEFLKACKENHLNTCIETCGFATWDKFIKIIEYADVIYYDIKHMDSAKHKELTGVENELILENARRIGENRSIIIRIPAIPGINDDDENLSRTILFASQLAGLKRIELLPYHTLGEEKYNLIGKKYHMKGLKAYQEDQKKTLQDKIRKINTKIEIKIL